MSRVPSALVACAVVVNQPAWAQDGWELRPSLSTMQVHDTNLFVTSSDRQTDSITRITPVIESVYQSTKWTINGRYGFDIERFDRHHELDGVGARRDAVAVIEYRPTRRLTLAADGQLSRTQTPGELNTLTALAFTRARADRLSAHGSLTRQFHRITKGTIDYRFTDERLADSLAIRTHEASIGTEHPISSRDKVKLATRVHQFSFESTDRLAWWRPEETGASTTTSAALTFGWTRAITRQSEFEIDAGPRVTNGRITPELSAGLRFRLVSRSFLLAYRRTETTIIGLPQTAQTHSATATAAWNLRRWLQINMSPGVVLSEIAARQAIVYRLTIDVVHPIGKGVSVAFAGAGYLQNGNLYSPLVNETIQQRSLMLKVIAEPGVRRR